MANVGAKGAIRYEEVFVDPGVLGTGVQGLDGGTRTANWLQNIDTGDTSFVRSMSAARGLHIAGSLAGTDNNMVEFCGDQLMFYGSVGMNAIDVLVQFDVATNIAFNFGFSDDVTETSNTLPVELSATSFASSASTYLGFVFDTDATNDEIHCFWTDDDVDSTEVIGDLRMKGMSLTANKWLWLRVEMQDRGSGSGVRATFHAVQDGKHMTKEFNTTVDNDAGLCWHFSAENRSAVAHGVYIKLPSWEQTISD